LRLSSEFKNGTSSSDTFEVCDLFERGESHSQTGFLASARRGLRAFACLAFSARLSLAFEDEIVSLRGSPASLVDEALTPA
jgi:hypothetical protein